jgi:hypothetical protein
MPYSDEEYLDMVLLYGECNQNATVAAEEYAARFPNRRRPNPHVILRLISRARHKGSLNLTLKGVAGAPHTVRVHAMEEAVLEAVDKTLEGVCVSYHKCVVLQNPQPIKLSKAIIYIHTIISGFNIYERKTILEKYAFVDGY